MRHSAQTGFYAADNDGNRAVNAADQVTVHHRGMIRTLSGLSPRRISIVRPVFSGYKIMIHHGIHISGGNKKAQPWASKNGNAFFILPVRLGYDAHTVAVGFQDAADNGMSEGRVIHIGVAYDIDEIRLCNASLFHLFFCNR